MKLRGHRHRYLRTAAAIASGVLAFPAAVHAADLPLKAPALKAVYDWTGLYIGAHAGYSRGSSSFALNDGTAINGSGVFSGMIGGVQAGYNYRLNSGWLVGVEGDFSFPNYITSNSIVSFLATPANTVIQQWGLHRQPARPRRLHQRSMARLCHRRLCVDGRALFRHAGRGRRPENPEHAARLDRGCRHRIRLRAALERTARISL
ncbi:hypothetical protein ACVWZ3_009351 [Bradyrhizobium sp. i1.3.6]